MIEDPTLERSGRRASSQRRLGYNRSPPGPPSGDPSLVFSTNEFSEYGDSSEFSEQRDGNWLYPRSRLLQPQP